MPSNELVLTDAMRERMHDVYRHLHRNPELSMQEFRTAEFIEERLSALGVEHFRCGGTGVVGVVRNGDGPVVAFRADSDGLPIAEDTGFEYASEATGRLEDGTEVPVMHGCGHDTHVASLLAATEVFVSAPGAWTGTLVLIFQPGEETGAGARAMVEDGLWDRAPRPAVVLGQHVMPGLAGTVQYPRGSAMSYADSWKVTLHGRQSHGSQPQDAIDPIVLGAHIVTRLQTVVSREIDAREAAVVTVGTFHAGLKENIIPASAEFTLNIRTLDDAVRERVLAAVRRIITAEASVSGAPEPVIEELYRFPRNFNDPEATDARMADVAAELGADAVTEVRPLMGSEDFGALATAIDVPSVYWFFGGYTAEQLEADTVPVNHSPAFAPVMEPTLTTAVRAATAAISGALGGADV